jgi:hypothetical protein
MRAHGTRARRFGHGTLLRWLSVVLLLLGSGPLHALCSGGGQADTPCPVGTAHTAGAAHGADADSSHAGHSGSHSPAGVDCPYCGLICHANLILVPVPPVAPVRTGEPPEPQIFARPAAVSIAPLPRPPNRLS